MPDDCTDATSLRCLLFEQRRDGRVEIVIVSRISIKRRSRSMLYGVILVSAAVHAEEVASSADALHAWPQWRGPSSCGVSADLPLPVEWSADKNIVWRAKPAGPAASSPIIWGDRVFVTSQVGTVSKRAGRSHPRLTRDAPDLVGLEGPMAGTGLQADSEVWLVVEAFDRKTGERLWDHRTPATGPFSALHDKAQSCYAHGQPRKENVSTRGSVTVRSCV